MDSTLPHRVRLNRLPRFRAMVRPRYILPGDLAPASLGDRRRFYERGMDYASAREWMASPPGERVYALIVGRPSGIYPRRFRPPKNVRLVADDVRDANGLPPYRLKYLPAWVDQAAVLY